MKFWWHESLQGDFYCSCKDSSDRVWRIDVMSLHRKDGETIWRANCNQKNRLGQSIDCVGRMNPVDAMKAVEGIIRRRKDLSEVMTHGNWVLQKEFKNKISSKDEYEIQLEE